MAIHVTDEDIREWETRLVQIDQEAAALQKERDLLSRKLAAVPLFQASGNGRSHPVASSAASTVGASEPGDQAADSPTLPEAVRKILEPRPSHYTKLTLRKALLESGLPQAKLGTRYNYYYTVLGRMESSGELSWDRRGRLTLRRREDGQQPHLVG